MQLKCGFRTSAYACANQMALSRKVRVLMNHPSKVAKLNVSKS